jgi:hypothetical protein
MANVLQNYEPDARVKVKILRDSRARTLSVSLCDVAAQAGIPE